MFPEGSGFGQNDHMVQTPHLHFVALQLDCFLSCADVGIHIPEDFWDSVVLNLRLMLRKS